MAKAKLIIEQNFKQIEMEFDDMTEASLMAEKIMPNCTKGTTFTITYTVEEVKGV